MLRPWEIIYVYRCASAVTICALVAALCLTIIFPAGAFAWWLIATLLLLFATMWEDPNSRPAEHRRRVARMKDARGMRGRKRHLAITPIGEDIQIIFREKMENGTVRRTKYIFHAEHEAEQAHACVDRLNNTSASPKFTVEAEQLAKVLSEKA